MSADGQGQWEDQVSRPSTTAREVRVPLVFFEASPVSSSLMFDGPQERGAFVSGSYCDPSVSTIRLLQILIIQIRVSRKM